MLTVKELLEQIQSKKELIGEDLLNYKVYIECVHGEDLKLKLQKLMKLTFY